MGEGPKPVRKKRSSPKTFSAEQLADAVDMRLEDVDRLIDADLLRSPLRGNDFNQNLRFNEVHLTRLRVIKRALDHGFRLEEVRLLVDHERMVTCRDAYEMAERNLPALRQRLGDNAPAILMLERLMNACSKRGGRRDCPIIAALQSDNI
jgi:DNA-binding transcriptional MerR regulator